MLEENNDSFSLEWHGSLFMGFPKGEGLFIPDTENDKKLWLANELAFKIRKAIKNELGYNASAGISVNKTVAKIACTYNKPNGQTVVPKRYLKIALSDVPIRNIRMLGGKLGKQLKEAGLETMGEIQTLDVTHELMPIVGDKA